MFHWKTFWKSIEWKLYGPLLEIDGFLIIHNNCIFLYYGYSIEIVRIYYGFSGVIANVIVWISHFFPVFVSSISCYFIPVWVSKVGCWIHAYESHSLPNKMCSHCLFPVVDKSGTSWYHLVARMMRPTHSQQVVPTNLIPSARNKLLTCTSWLLRADCISLVGTTCSKSVIIINLVTTW